MVSLTHVQGPTGHLPAALQDFAVHKRLGATPHTCAARPGSLASYAELLYCITSWPTMSPPLPVEAAMICKARLVAGLLPPQDVPAALSSVCHCK